MKILDINVFAFSKVDLVEELKQLPIVVSAKHVESYALMEQKPSPNFQRSDEQMCLLYGATAQVVNRRGGSQSTNSFSPALCS